MDWTNLAIIAIGGLTPAVTLFGVWALKLAYSKIPASLMFVAAPLIGILANKGLEWIAGHSGDYTAIAAAGLGLLAIVIREFITTINAKGLGGPVSQTKAMF
jgi:hypothetical protein